LYKQQTVLITLINQIMKTLTSLLLGSVLLVSAVGCTTARTSSSAPDTADSREADLNQPTAQTNQDDATSELRRRQLNSDIRAAEQRNNMTGGDTEKADGDLQSEVRSKLEANLPASELTIEAKDGIVTVTGTVVDQDQLDKIEPLAKEIKGVQSVMVNATLQSAAQPDPPESNSDNITDSHTGTP
jgi:hyperosmotically inducible periplasmic protein